MTWRADVDMSWSLASGSPGTNSWFYRVVSGDPSASLDAATEKLRVFYNAIRPLYPANVKISFSGLWRGANTTDAGKSYVADAWEFMGQGGSSFLPPANAVLLRRAATSGGRAAVGHAFLGPAAESTLSPDGRVAENTITLVTTAANALLSPGGNDGAFGVQSRSTETFRDYQAMQVSRDFAALRSRRD